MKRVKTVKQNGVHLSLLLTGLVLVSGLSGTAQAALQGRDLNGSAGSFEAYYDTNLNITWLADANVNGAMTWADANNWATGLSIVDTINNITYADWRLPTSDNCEGDNCINSDLGHLFYTELGGTAGQSILTSADPDLAKFSNLQADAYWSDTLYDANNAWNFSFKAGGQEYDGTLVNDIYALAVSTGDVGNITAVPEVDTWAMLLAGLGLVGFAARRRKTHFV